LLERIQPGRDIQRRTDGDENSPNAERVDPGARYVIVFGIVSGVIPEHPGHQQLTDLLPDRKRRQE
jgi:hypothetical protein